jgi:hypothetical protein
LLGRLNPGPVLDDAKIAKIISMSEGLAEVPWEPIAKEECSNEEDYEIYTH